MLLRVIALFLFSCSVFFPLYALENVTDPTCNEASSLKVLEPEDFSPVLRQALKIDHWAASTKDIRTSECRDKMPSLSEITQMNKDFYGSGDQSAVIGGVSLEGESPDSLMAFTDLLTNRGTFKNEMDTKDVSKKVPQSCKKVACATEAVFGKELGQKLLYLKQFGFNGSEIAHDSSSRFRKDEVDSIIRSVRAFPKGLFPLDTDKQITKFKRGYTLKVHGDKTLAFARIAFYDLWSDGNYSKEQMESTSFHEIAHYISSELDLDESPEWMAISGWVDHGDFQYSSARKDNFCSHYAKDSPGEDFAESLVAYRYNPELLQAASMEKYNFIKENVFGGVEYTSQKECQGKRIFPQIKNDHIETIIANQPFSLKEALESCSDASIELILNEPNSAENFDNCIQSEATNIQLSDDDISDLVANLSPPPKYPQLTEELFRQTFNNLGIERPYDPNIIGEARQHLKDRVTEKIFNSRNNPGAFVSVFGGGDIKEACKKNWTGFVYQEIDIFTNHDSGNINTSAYKKREEIEQFLRQMCVNSNRRGGRMILEDIQKELDHITSP